jgi:Fe-S cluster biogenesis protein NfuA
MTTSDTRSGTSEDRLEQTAARLDQAMARVDALGADERVVVADALAALDALHKDALTTVVRRLRDDDRGRELLYTLVDEPEVRMVLSMHGIIRPDPVTLAHRALERVRPTLASHGGDVELDRIEEGVAHVRLHGACNGCSMSAVTLRDSVEEALRAGVPGLVGVEVVPNDPTTTVIPLESLTVLTAGTDEELRASGWSAPEESPRPTSTRAPTRAARSTGPSSTPPRAPSPARGTACATTRPAGSA